jgi:hypothetical protein
MTLMTVMTIKCRGSLKGVWHPLLQTRDRVMSQGLKTLLPIKRDADPKRRLEATALSRHLYKKIRLIVNL